MKKAFSIIEILVVLGLFVVVSAMGLLAYNIVQKNARDSDRKNVLGEISAEIEDYQKINKTLPQTSMLVFNQNEVLLNSQKIVELTGSNRSAAETDASKTSYYYEKTTTGYILCAKLESGRIQSAGTVKDGCEGKL